MIKIAICDDDVQMTTDLEQQLYNIAISELTEIEIDIFFDGVELENIILQGQRYDLIYLDIEMKRQDGLQAAKFIREFDDNVIIFYVSSYECYLKQLFEVQPLGFIDKPIDKKELYKSFIKARKLIVNKKYYYEYKFNKNIYKVVLTDILYFESNKRSVVIHMKNESEHNFYGKLNDIEDEVENYPVSFLRIHQSYYVNCDYIKIKRLGEVVLSNGVSLPISEERQKSIRKKYNEKLRTDLFDD